ncbi:MAG: Ig-like domain-containing protein [Candidatus Heimdallarchaeaceae archaeon]
MKKNRITLISAVLIVTFCLSIVPAVTNAAVPRVAPQITMKILSPNDGDVVSGVITIELSESGDVYIDGFLMATEVTSYTWDTTTVANGDHTIKAQGYGHPRNFDEITVTVNNGGGSDNPPVVTITDPADGATVKGTVTITVSITDDIDDNLVADIYIDGTFVISANSYSWDTTAYSDGAHTIYAETTDSGSNTGSDQVGVTVDNSGSSGGDGIVNKWAVIVGISDYKAISDLSYCDEDATDWYYQLNSLGYSIEVYGDGHTSDYPIYTGIATEANVKAAILNMISKADEDDIIAYISSGHGGADRVGPPSSRHQYLCMWDCASGEDGEDGYIYDTEFEQLFANIICKTFIFLDHCYSGGMDEVMNAANSHLIYMTTTCTDNGYGYDDSTHQNGAWTYYFLDYSWQTHFGGSASVSMEDIYAYAHAAYPYGAGDEPQEFDGDAGSLFYL